MDEGEHNQYQYKREAPPHDAHTSTALCLFIRLSDAAILPSRGGLEALRPRT